MSYLLKETWCFLCSQSTASKSHFFLSSAVWFTLIIEYGTKNLKTWQIGIQYSCTNCLHGFLIGMIEKQRTMLCLFLCSLVPVFPLHFRWFWMSSLHIHTLVAMLPGGPFNVAQNTFIRIHAQWLLVGIYYQKITAYLH